MMFPVRSLSLGSISTGYPLSILSPRRNSILLLSSLLAISRIRSICQSTRNKITLLLRKCWRDSPALSNRCKWGSNVQPNMIKMSRKCWNQLREQFSILSHLSMTSHKRQSLPNSRKLSCVSSVSLTVITQETWMTVIFQLCNRESSKPSLVEKISGQ